MKVAGSTCEGCYALKGCYVFKVVQAAQYRRLASIKHELDRRHGIINKVKNQNILDGTTLETYRTDHLTKIFAVCRLTPETSTGYPHEKPGLKIFAKVLIIWL